MASNTSQNVPLIARRMYHVCMYLRWRGKHKIIRICTMLRILRQSFVIAFELETLTHASIHTKHAYIAPNFQHYQSYFAIKHCALNFKGRYYYAWLYLYLIIASGYKSLLTDWLRRVVSGKFALGHPLDHCKAGPNVLGVCSFLNVTFWKSIPTAAFLQARIFEYWKLWQHAPGLRAIFFAVFSLRGFKSWKTMGAIETTCNRKCSNSSQIFSNRFFFSFATIANGKVGTAASKYPALYIQ